MSLITKIVQIKVRTKTIKEYYNNLGYECDVGDIINIKVEHLTKGSNVLVNVKCDCESCTTPILNPVKWYDYLKCVRENGKYYCRKCSSKLYGSINQRKTKLKNSKSFEQWCIENNRQDVLDRWDYELNDCKPSEVTFSTIKKYYFECPKEIHNSELKNISSFTSGQEGSIACKACNSFTQWGIDNLGEDFLEKYWDYEKNISNPWEFSRFSRIDIWIKCQEKDYHGSYVAMCADFVAGNRCPYCSSKKIHKLDSLGKLLEDKDLLNVWSDKNKNSPYKYAPKSGKKVWWKCPNQKHEDYKRGIDDSNKYNFRCPGCTESKGEKQLDYILTKYNIPHDSQFTFDDLRGISNGLLKFDIPAFWDKEKTKLRMLIEYDGEQHFRPKRFGGISQEKAEENFRYVQYHDKLKNKYCQNNNIKLLRIPYWEFNNIEQILNQHLNLLKAVV